MMHQHDPTNKKNPSEIRSTGRWPRFSTTETVIKSKVTIVLLLQLIFVATATHQMICTISKPYIYVVAFIPAFWMQTRQQPASHSFIAFSSRCCIDSRRKQGFDVTTTGTRKAVRGVLSMADNNDVNANSDNDDALSKLIGKRNQIKRQSGVTSGGSGGGTQSRTELMKQIEEKLSTSTEPIMDLDLDQLPEFQTPRVKRRLSSSSDQTTGSATGSDTDDAKNAKKDAPIIDYMADYDDENDWHIPNRIVISSIAWGDVNRNFVVSSQSSPSSSSSSAGKGKNSPTGTKLTKRLQKMGKFVAGDVQVAIQKCISNGILGIETSSSYGKTLQGQKSSAHDILRVCINDAIDIGLPEPMIIESLQRRDISSLRNLLLRPSTSMVSNLEDTLGRLGVSNSGAVDMFIVPKYWGVPLKLMARALVSQIESGQTNYIGVSGITKASTLRTLQEQIQNNDCTLSTNVFPFSLTNQKYLYMINVCKDLGIVPLISDPLDGGLSSGVYTAMNPSGGLITTSQQKKNKFSFAQLEKLQPLHSVQETLCDRVRTRVIRNMSNIQDKYRSLSRYSDSQVRDINTDITTTQIATQYIIAKGGVPLVSVNNPIQADDILGCLGWSLTDEEVAMLDSAIALCKL